MSNPSNFAIGIDLGTTNSVVAVYKEGELTVLHDEQGESIIPSVVSFDNDRYYVGHEAAKRKINNPEKTISEIKRLMGKQFNDRDIQEDLIRWPFKVINENGKPKVQVSYLHETRKFLPEQLSAYILLKLKKMVCEHLDLPTNTPLKAVVAVPVYFNDSQRTATIEAGKIAKLDVTLMNECSAAAIAYSINKEWVNDETVLVFDMGGGTTDVALLKIQADNKIDVIDNKGNNHLGGEDIDTALVEHCKTYLQEAMINIDNNNVALGRLRTKIESAKCTLTHAPRAKIFLSDIVNNQHFDHDLHKATFESVCRKTIEESIKLVKSSLSDAKVTPDKVNRVILAGGSTRIPLLRQRLQETLPGVRLIASINQDEAVAHGAAVQAAHLQGILQKNLKLSEIIPWSLGVGLSNGTVSKIIPKKTSIPTKKSGVYVTAYDNQSSVNFPIYEGEKEMEKDNKKLGSFALHNIKLAKKGETKFDLTYEVDRSGVFYATAVEKGAENNKMKVEIERYKESLSKEQIEQLAEDLEHESLVYAE